MKRICSIFLLSVLTGCAASPEISSEERSRRSKLAEIAVVNSMDCAQRNIAETDDGISDATTVAFILSNKCRKEYEESVEAFIYSKVDENENVKQLVRARLNSKEAKTDTFLSTVSRYRVEKNKIKNK